MGYNLTYSEHNEDTLEARLFGIEADSQELLEKMLKLAGERVKERVVAELNKHRRILATRYKGRPAMADDVRISTKADKYGEKTAKVMGGKKTGTLWHLVNDGNLHSQPTHFMDNAIKDLDRSIDEIWKEAER